MEELSKDTIRIGIHQPGYHRYCGYFYKMFKSDLFISLDTVQYVSREWQNRQIFYDGENYKWLSVPVKRGREPIKDKKIVDNKKIKDHWKYIRYIYKDTPYFDNYSDLLESIYLKRDWEYLNDLCDSLILLAKDILGIQTKYIRDSKNGYSDKGLKKADLLIDSIKRAVNFSHYNKVIYLPRNYPIPDDFYLNKKFGDSDIKEIEKFKLANIDVQTYRFKHPNYKQHQYKDNINFIPNLSIFDLIFNCGPESLKVLKSGGESHYDN